MNESAPQGDPGRDCPSFRACMDLPTGMCVCLKQAQRPAAPKGEPIERDGFGPRTPLRWPAAPTKLVPTIPTQAMLDAADKVLGADPIFMARAYRAMLVAAIQGEPQCASCVGTGHSPSNPCAYCVAAPQAAPSVAAPDGWVLVPKIGTRVKADHPRTVLNPSEYFEVTQVRAESDGNFAVRGEETCWFGLRMLAALPLPGVVQAAPGDSTL